MKTITAPALLIYGATGYTGTLIAEEAARTGVDFAVAGRDRTKVEALAARLGVTGRAFALDDPAVVRDELSGARVLLNVAGPFSLTADKLIDASIAEGVHYLDTTAELATYQLAEQRSDAAAAAGVMLVPGVGWDVVPSDAVAVHAASRTAHPVAVRVALKVTGGFSRGSVSSAAGIAEVFGLVRAAGQLVTKAEPVPAVFDLGGGPEEFNPVPMGDLVTAWHSLGVDDVEVFMRADGAIPTPGEELPDGPTEAERLEGRYWAFAEVTDADGSIVRSVIETPTGYTYTSLSAVEAARRVIAGQHQAGFRTPSAAFGPDFATSIADSHVTDL
ncbi:MAG: saccharopine dehydrogenase NADP-binding domain-containing protein [Aeromicrobium sp.]